MLCESEMEIEQHTCWSGQDVVERFVCLLYHFNAKEGPAKHQECTTVALSDLAARILSIKEKSIWKGRGKKYCQLSSRGQARAEISGLYSGV